MVQSLVNHSFVRSISRQRHRQRNIPIQTTNNVKNIVESIERKISGSKDIQPEPEIINTHNLPEEQTTENTENVTLDIVEPETEPATEPATEDKQMDVIPEQDNDKIKDDKPTCSCGCVCCNENKENSNSTSVVDDKVTKYKIYHGTSKDITFVNTNGDILEIPLETMNPDIPYILEVYVDGILEGDYDFSDQHKNVSVALEYKLNNTMWYACDKKKTMKLQNKSMKHYINWNTLFHFSIPKSNTETKDIVYIRLKSLIDNRRIKLTDLHLDVFVKY